MTRRAGVWVLGLSALCACADPAIGTRYRLERDLWSLRAEVQRLEIRPELVTADQWRSVASGFEAAAGAHKVSGTSPAAVDVRTMQAGALMHAARIFATAGDTTRLFDLYARIEREFSDMPSLTGEVALARGQLAEARSEWPAAVSAYRDVIANVPPKLGDRGAAGAVMELPLRVARLEVRLAGDSTLAFRRRTYAEPRQYYQRAIGLPDTATALAARSNLAEMAADLQEWETAERELRTVEEGLRGMTPPPMDPAGVRFAIAQVQSRRDRGGPAAEATLRSVVTDYPKSTFAPQALMAQAQALAGRGQFDAAVEITRELRKSYSDNEALASRALLFQGQLLERAQKWTEAQQVFASIPSEHPVSEAALLSHLEVVSHYERTGDAEGVRSALTKAEAAYRDFIVRYPTGRPSLSAREMLARTLLAQKRYDLAVEEFTRLGDALLGKPEGVNFLLTAAQISLNQLADTTRAADLLAKTGTAYPDREVGRWAAGEAARLRGSE